MNFSCEPGCRALKTNPSVLRARSVGLSVEFRRLLGAQAERHRKALRCGTSARRGKKGMTCHREILDKKKKKHVKNKLGERTRGVLVAGVCEVTSCSVFTSTNCKQIWLIYSDNRGTFCSYAANTSRRHQASLSETYQCVLSARNNSPRPRKHSRDDTSTLPLIPTGVCGVKQMVLC